MQRSSNLIPGGGDEQKSELGGVEPATQQRRSMELWGGLAEANREPEFLSVSALSVLPTSFFPGIGATEELLLRSGGPSSPSPGMR